MSSFITTFIVAVSLSMDAFSLALIYGMQGMNRKDKILLAFIVGLYHFVMPLIGIMFGSVITRYLVVNTNIMVGILFMIIGIEMIISSIRNEEVKILISISGFLMFGLTVSIDSFTTGIGLRAINNNYLEVSTIFFFVSSLFTYLGLVLGNKIGNILGKISTLFGGIILSVLGIIYMIK